MNKTRLYASILALALAVSPICAASGTPAWEPVKTEIRDAKSVMKHPDIEILTAPSTIIVNCSRQVDIKIFTILGRVVSSETLPPGVSRLSVGAHGVYIVKVGELTCKIAL